MVRVRVTGWAIHYSCESPHKDRNTRVCVCMAVCLKKQFLWLL